MPLAAVLTTPQVATTFLGCRIVQRSSATFFIMEPDDRTTVPDPRAYAGEIEFAGRLAPCAIRVVGEGAERMLWCQPRGPLSRTVEGDQVLLRLDPA